ncbi:hypothetical protein [Streptomyces sp. NPDC059802]|uniref:hypothetical protein n=1 Tax=Streptomyces sp. NPDC059802 TaxID=3346952 RepID=UPI003667F505
MRPVSKIERSVAPFEVVSPYQPSGDQPAAIAELERRIRADEKDVVLLGATGGGKGGPRGGWGWDVGGAARGWGGPPRPRKSSAGPTGSPGAR